MTKKDKKTRLLVFFMLAVFVMVAFTISHPKQTDNRTLVIGIGVDRQDDNYLMSTQVLVPEASASFKEILQVYTATGRSLLECVENMSLHLGKITGFGNVSVIVFGEQVANEGIVSAMDFFMRSKRINDNATIITTNRTAKELLETVAKIDKSFAYNLNNLAKLNSQFTKSKSTNMYEFISNYYSQSNASFVSQIRLEEDESLGISGQNPTGESGSSQQVAATPNNEQQSNEQQNNEQQKNLVVSNSGYTSMFVDGRQVAVAGPEQMIGFNVLTESSRGLFSVDGVSDQILTNAKIDMSLKSSHRLVRYEFKNGIPRVHFDIKFYVKVENISQQNNPLILNGTKYFLSEQAKAKFVEKVKSQIAESINLSKQYDADVLGLQNSFYKHKPNEWKTYIKNLADKSQAFQNIEIFVDVQVDDVL